MAHQPLHRSLLSALLGDIPATCKSWDGATRTWRVKQTPKPSKRLQGLIDRMKKLHRYAGIERRGRNWEVWDGRGATAVCQNLWAVGDNVESFEEQASKRRGVEDVPEKGMANHG